ncbi:MAG: hypothetical protein QF787_12310 [Nitrospinota bacterium]|jgi:hypothetical protein|nr:hypothetical protein [Nitrospinota bacterium]|tara:strand:+ start:3818 stop:3970 length:153 start_codon:yes stop_codon:yes gene_type:complete
MPRVVGEVKSKFTVILPAYTIDTPRLGGFLWPPPVARVRAPIHVDGQTML